ncbi:MAG TPA: EAL domain-containing protein [Nitrosospira sp.]|nr:EAL domain-containing protein [Nitrosospira sp.]
MITASRIFNSRILIVDDRKENVELILGMLDHAGYTAVSFTTDPRTVCSLHRANRYDLILLDIVMPLMDGFKVMECLREIGETGEWESVVPILVITGQPAHRERALRGGAKGFISKPINRLQMLTRIHDVLEIGLLRGALRQSIAAMEKNAGEPSGAFQDQGKPENQFEPGKLPGEDQADCSSLVPDDLKQVEYLSRRPIDKAADRYSAEGVEDGLAYADRTWGESGLAPRYDELTGLPNRALFFESLRKTIRQTQASQRVISVLVLDIDNFKNVDDMMGPSFGDELLRQFSLRLLECLRVRDVIARLGSDEFGCIVMTPEGSGNAGVVASKIREALRPPFELHGNHITLTVSIGISVYPADSPNPDTLIKNSRAALYESKKAGGDTHRFFTEEMNAQAIRKLDRENALRRAINRNEFVLYYQPQVALSDGSITGMEALIRWNRPGYGLVAPMEFVPILEQTGLINVVGAWVIEAACRQIAEWKQLGLGEIPVSINVSGRQFSQDALSRDVVRATRRSGIGAKLLEFEFQTERALRESSIDSNLLELELTETSLMMHANKMIDILRNLKSLGVRLSIDDFGTGYSSLAYVKRFPIDVLKIDRSFVVDIVTNPSNAAITTAIIDMAHSLNVKVIAEGVETAEQCAFLHARGCDEIQGYYFSEPLSAKEVSAMLANRHKLPVLPMTAKPAIS